MFKLRILFHWLLLLLRPQFRDRKALERWQTKRLALFFKNTMSHSAFYRKQMDSGRDWREMPIMDKPSFMAHFDELNTTGISLTQAMTIALDAERSRDFKSEWNGITIGLSTGTSGKRGIFLVAEKERAQWVSAVMHRVIKPKLFKKQRVAFFLRANSNLYASVQSALFAFSYYDIFKPIEELLSKLDSFNPHVLAGQPSVLMDIAKAKANGSIHLQPSMVISFAEVLHEADKAVIEQTFGCPIREVYQCTEGFLGVTCNQGTMHLNEDFIHVEPEWIDDEHFYPIVTDFTRSSQPVVRYRMNDVLRLKKDGCSCGSVHLAIEKIIGRDDDVLMIDGKRIYPDLIARRIAQVTDGFQRYSITQTAPRSLAIGIETQPEKMAEVQEDYRKSLLSILGDVGITGIEMEFSNTVDHEPGQKLRKIKRTCQ